MDLPHRRGMVQTYLLHPSTAVPRCRGMAQTCPFYRHVAWLQAPGSRSRCFSPSLLSRVILPRLEIRKGVSTDRGRKLCDGGGRQRADVLLPQRVRSFDTAGPQIDFPRTGHHSPLGSQILPRVQGALESRHTNHSEAVDLWDRIFHTPERSRIPRLLIYMF